MDSLPRIVSFVKFTEQSKSIKRIFIPNEFDGHGKFNTTLKLENLTQFEILALFINEMKFQLSFVMFIRKLATNTYFLVPRY